MFVCLDNIDKQLLETSDRIQVSCSIKSKSLSQRDVGTLWKCLVLIYFFSKLKYILTERNRIYNDHLRFFQEL